jgi:hypothetical protein
MKLNDSEAKVVKSLWELTIQLLILKRLHLISRALHKYREGKNKYKNKGGFRWCIALQCAAIVVLLSLLTASWYKQPTEDHPIDRKFEGSPRQEDTQSGNSVNKVV